MLHGTVDSEPPKTKPRGGKVVFTPRKQRVKDTDMTHDGRLSDSRRDGRRLPTARSDSVTVRNAASDALQ